MKTDELTALGLTEEQVQKVLAMNGKDINQLKASNDAAQTELSGLREQLKAAGETIDGLKKLDAEGLKRAAQEWKDKYAADTAALQEKINAQAKDAAVRLAVAKENVHDEALTMAALDLGKVIVAEDGAVSGLSEQVAVLREQKPFLFKTGKVEQNYNPAGGKPADDGAFAFNFMGVRDKPKE